GTSAEGRGARSAPIAGIAVIARDRKSETLIWTDDGDQERQIYPRMSADNRGFGKENAVQAAEKASSLTNRWGGSKNAGRDLPESVRQTPCDFLVQNRPKHIRIRIHDALGLPA
ncbi:MAG: hypothetical protein ACXVJ1_06255, partial [Candidatus Angelobacter sp.]